MIPPGPFDDWACRQCMYALTFPPGVMIIHESKFEHVFSIMVSQMGDFLYLYDCKNARRINARRVSFTKELFGYVYSWKTKTGMKQKRRSGLLDECPGANAVADSAIFVPSSYRSVFDALFSSFSDILSVTVYEVSRRVD